VALGSHRLTGSRPFGVFVYGFDSFDSYGYPGGMSLAPVAVVTTVALTPKTATTVVGDVHCVNAAIADQNGKPVSGVRVDFNVTGANTASGSANTDANGVAAFCYTGANTGTDTITASVGALSDVATNEQRPRETRFAAFYAEARVRSGGQEFDVEGLFTLGTGSDGIDPINEQVTLTAGKLAVTIPAGTFRSETAALVGFEKVIDGRKVEASIAAGSTPGTFTFEFEVSTPDPTGGVDRIPVALTIGNDAGSTIAKVERKR
jgi:hypothetical protein